MRKRLFAALLAASLTLSVSIGCMTAFASQTEADGTQTTEAEAALASSAADETEAETASPFRRVIVIHDYQFSFS